MDVPEMDLVVSRDQCGEICIRGPVVSPGYYNDEENTRAPFDPPELGGWLHTGDIGAWTSVCFFLFLLDIFSSLTKLPVTIEFHYSNKPYSIQIPE